jgi:hypothetical protein
MSRPGLVGVVGAARSNAPFLVVVALVATGVLYSAVVPAHWLRGVMVAAGGFSLATVLRLLLPNGSAGMLETRRKTVDVMCFGTISVLIVTVGALLPR